jgi:Lon protease-like protein
MPLPLRIFEPRYRAMLADRLEAAERGEPPEYGVVLIERGHEVGGGEQRFDRGTLARFTTVAEQLDGTWSAMSIGTDRLEVQAWLPDDPYPLADVDIVDDLVFDEAEHADLLAGAEREVRRALVLKSEMAERAWPATVALDDDPVASAWQLAAVAPIGPLDQQRLLGSTSLAGLLTDLTDLVAEASDVLRFRLSNS